MGFFNKNKQSKRSKSKKSNLQDYDENHKILLKLVKAKDENEVQTILEDCFFNNIIWKPFGKNESNYNIINNQQSDPVNALCEKPINSIDHILIKECKKLKIDPESKHAPKSMKFAVEKFFKIKNADLSKLTEIKRRKLADNIMIIADGDKKNPNIIIADRGEGQSPDKFEDTLLSLSKGNKIKTQFVQGKFNMGGTGVLTFCGNFGYQLILSRKSVELPGNDLEWGFTLVREKPDVDPIYRSTWYEFCVHSSGNILRLKSKTLNILPRKKPLIDGCFIKLYSYQLPDKSLITNGLWQSMNIKLFFASLPILMIEDRAFKLTPGKNDTKLLLGNKFRTRNNKKHVYKIINITSTLQGFGNTKIEVTIFRHQSEIGKNKTKYFTGTTNAIFLTRNGQTHSEITKNVFKTKLHLFYLADYVMIHVDLTNIPKDKEKMFMANREKTRSSDDYKKFEERLFDDIKEDDALKAINNEYAQLDKSNISKDTSVDTIISKILKKNPNLTRDLDLGETPFENKGSLTKEQPFIDRYIPTYLKVGNSMVSNNVTRKISIDGESTYIHFQTDAPNDYLTRDVDQGELIISDLKDVQQTNHSPHNGKFHIKLIISTNYNFNNLSKTLVVTLTRPKSDPLVCNVKLVYEKTCKGKQIKPKPPKKKRSSGLSQPKLDTVTNNRWKEYDWDENDIAKFEPEVIHINVSCKCLTDFTDHRASSDTKKINKIFSLAMYFHALRLHLGLKDEQDYDVLFKKTMQSIASADLPIIYDLKDIAIDKLISKLTH